MEMAREAGFTASSNPDLYDIMLVSDKSLEVFAALVRKDEREALCKLMEDQNTWDLYDPNATAIEIIRARGQA
jgi:hypothetical protein